MDLADRHIDVSVLFDTVKIELRCKSDYEAQVAFDDIADTLKNNGSITISVHKSKITNEL